MCKFYRVFFRDAVSFPDRGQSFEAVELKNISPILAAPVVAHYIKYPDLYSNKIGFDDILDMNDILKVKAENEYRSAQAVKEDRKS